MSWMVLDGSVSECCSVGTSDEGQLVIGADHGARYKYAKWASSTLAREVSALALRTRKTREGHLRLSSGR